VAPASEASSSQNIGTVTAALIGILSVGRSESSAVAGCCQHRLRRCEDLEQPQFDGLRGQGASSVRVAELVTPLW
jgi:hypothetical protein